MTWESIYDFLGIKDFIYFISSSELQHTLLPVKLVFIGFSIFFFIAVIYFLLNSSYLNYHFLEDTVEFFSWQPYGLRQIAKRWQKIMKKTEGGSESDYKLAIIEADDLLYKTLEDKGYRGETFEQLLSNAEKKIMPSPEEILSAHAIRNSIVYDFDYKLDIEVAKGLLRQYEKAIKGA